MTAADRSFLIKRALLRALADCSGFPARAAAISEAASIKVDYLAPTTAELDAGLRAIDTDRLCVALPGERGRKLRLTEAGALWLAENS